MVVSTKAIIQLIWAIPLFAVDLSDQNLQPLSTLSSSAVNFRRTHDGPRSYLDSEAISWTLHTATRSNNHYSITTEQSFQPTYLPTEDPTVKPPSPTAEPTADPTFPPTDLPTEFPTQLPTEHPTRTKSPTTYRPNYQLPTFTPVSLSPTHTRSIHPTASATSVALIHDPSIAPTITSFKQSSLAPSASPVTVPPTVAISQLPNVTPSASPSFLQASTRMPSMIQTTSTPSTWSPNIIPTAEITYIIEINQPSTPWSSQDTQPTFAVGEVELYSDGVLLDPSTSTLSLASTAVVNGHNYSFLLDGDINTWFATSTSEPAARLWITLRRTFDRIVIYNRQDCCQIRLSGATIRVINADDQSVVYSNVFSTPLPLYIFNVDISSTPTPLTSTTCPAGSVGRNGVAPCYPCPDGYFSDPGSDLCSACVGFRANCKSGFKADVNFTAYIQSLDTTMPTQIPTGAPSAYSSNNPTLVPTAIPTYIPTLSPTKVPTASPSSIAPSASPTDCPTVLPTGIPSLTPTAISSTSTPSVMPTLKPSSLPTTVPTVTLTSSSPSTVPSCAPTTAPSTVSPSTTPTRLRTATPTTATPSALPTRLSTATPSTRDPQLFLRRLHQLHLRLLRVHLNHRSNLHERLLVSKYTEGVILLA